MKPNSLCWIRRDLRLHDHAALSAALKQGSTAVVFVFDTHILDKLVDKDDRRITFIMDSLVEIDHELQKHSSSLSILYGRPEEEIPKFAKKLGVTAVFANRDYEPYAKERDAKVFKALKKIDIPLHQYKDTVFFEKEEITTNTGGIYKVFTPYKNKWIERFEQNSRLVPNYKCPASHFWKNEDSRSDLKDHWFKKIGFTENRTGLPGGTSIALKQIKAFKPKIDNYEETRNFPVLAGTSSLSPYLRFGNISVRDLIRLASSSSSGGAKVWLSEIIWRDFYQMILDAYPQVEKEAFRPEYQNIRWLGKPEHFELWCNGQTGFPLIDASMRCLNETGFLHNRLRMVVASFFCKTLLLDWKKGERYFARLLLDYDLASNNGGWQWSASTGCDAQPYFRIFNPYNQSKKFDEEGEFIRHWCPELAHLSKKDIHNPPAEKLSDYPAPIVSYEKNRERALMMYSSVKLNTGSRTA